MHLSLDSYSSDEDDSDVSDQQKILHTTEKKPTSTLALTLNSSKLRIAMFSRSKVGYNKAIQLFSSDLVFCTLEQ
jgi:hypothetical protein